MRNITKKCKTCGQIVKNGKLNKDFASKSEKDIKKMKRVMKKNKLSQVKLSEILGISQSAVSSWFRLNVGSIKSKHFDVLRDKGYL